MPLPAFVGIPILVTFLTSIFTAVVSFFLQYFTKRMATFLAAVAAMLALFAGFLAIVVGAVNGLNIVLPPEAKFIGYYLPSNTSSCISAYSTVWVARYVYSWNNRLLTDWR